MSKRKAICAVLNVILWAGIGLGILGACTGNVVLMGVGFGAMVGGALLGGLVVGVISGIKDGLIKAAQQEY